jgi:hypothetical protein
MKLIKLMWKVLAGFVGFVLAVSACFELFFKLKIFGLKIPDIVPLLLILLLFIVVGCMVYYLHKQAKSEIISGAQKNEIEKFRKDLEGQEKTINNMRKEVLFKIDVHDKMLSRLYNQPEEYRLLPPDSEIVFILTITAGQRGMSVRDMELNEIYSRKFEGIKKGQADYNIIISKLQKYGLLSSWLSSEDHRNFTVTSKGLEYLDKVNKELEKAKPDDKSKGK